MNIYETCPTLESEKFIVRLFEDDDCDGDNFYYSTKERMAGAIGFWHMSYYTVERIKAIQKVGFTKSEHMLIGKTGYAYDGYWTIK